MTFCDALGLLRSGLKMTRKAWLVIDDYVELVETLEGELRFFRHNDQRVSGYWTVTHADLLADDWSRV